MKQREKKEFNKTESKKHQWAKEPNTEITGLWKRGMTEKLFEELMAKNFPSLVTVNSQENKNTTYQNLWDAIKSVLGRKLIAQNLFKTRRAFLFKSMTSFQP